MSGARPDIGHNQPEYRSTIVTGEAGLSAWGKALARAAQRWTVWVAPEALEGDASVAGQTLFPAGKPPSLDVRPTPKLHLAVAKRTLRAQHYAEWVNHVLEGNVKKVLISMALWLPYLLLSTRVNVTYRRRVPG